MKGQSGIGALAALVVMAAVMGFSATAWAQPAARDTWLNVTQFAVHVKPDAQDNGQGKDNFVIALTFNCEPDSFGPSTDVMLSLDELGVEIPAGMWQRVGNSNKYIAKGTDGVAQMDYWIKGSSRCQLKMSAHNQDIMNNFNNMPNVPVELVIGGVFDESVVVEMTNEETSAKLLKEGPAPLIVLDSFTMKRKLNATGQDSAIFAGRSALDVNDPTTLAMYLCVGSFEIVMPRGSLVLSKNGKMLTYRGTIDGAKVTVTADRTGKFLMSVVGADLSSVANPDTVLFEMSWPDGLGGTTRVLRGWNIQMQENGPGTQMKY